MLTDKDWQGFEQRLETFKAGIEGTNKATAEQIRILKESIEKRPFSWWTNLLVPVIAWAAAIASALLTAKCTADFQSTNAALTEIRTKIAKDKTEAYSQVSVLREIVFVGFERFIKTRGRKDDSADEASARLFTMLDTQKQLIPNEVEQPVRALNNYVNQKKVDLGKVPRDQWRGIETDILSEAQRRNETARSSLAKWYQALETQ
jgi:hypothetical protein